MYVCVFHLCVFGDIIFTLMIVTSYLFSYLLTILSQSFSCVDKRIEGHDFFVVKESYHVRITTKEIQQVLDEKYEQIHL